MSPPSPRTIDQEILFSTKDNIATITLNLPAQLNALTQPQYYHLAQLLRHIATLPEITITILTANGRFFSAGANVQQVSHDNSNPTTANNQNSSHPSQLDASLRKSYLQSFVSNNLEVGQAFATHPKILITALNGPVIGLSAALIAYSDFIYAVPDVYLLTPFSSLGLVSEGGASATFVQRMGIAKANEALIMSRRIPCRELVECGFVNKVFTPEVGTGMERKGFMDLVMHEVKERLAGGHLNARSLLLIKDMIRRPFRAGDEAATMHEVMVGLEGFVKGIPQKEFAAVAEGKKRHKL